MIAKGKYLLFNDYIYNTDTGKKGRRQEKNAETTGDGSGCVF